MDTVLRRRAIPHVLSSDQFSRKMLSDLFIQAASYQTLLHINPRSLQEIHAGRMISLVFYEASTRTRFSFSHAAAHLGMRVHETESARDFSSAAKGETIEDTIRVLMGYGSEVIVLRHHEEDGPARAAAVSTVPVISAGAGKGEHPTQALLDLYTIEKRLKQIDGLTVVIGGDLLNGRTARSLARLLCLYRPKEIIFVSPPQVRIGEDVKEKLTNARMPWQETEELVDTLPGADVVYWTRVQKERMSTAEYEAINGRYTIGLEEIGLMKRDAVLMHPLPRVGEIKQEVDGDPRACYFEQAHNGVPVRMALLTMLLEGTFLASLS